MYRGFLNRTIFESVENFTLFFTGTQPLAEVGPLVEHEIFILAVAIKNIIEYPASRSEIRNISMRAMFFGFLVIALELSAFRRDRK